MDHLPQGLILGLCLTLIFLVVTLSRPKSSSNSIRTPSIDPPTTISSQPIVTVTSQPTTDGHTDSLPVLTYYYIWFDTQSWDRAKKDYPLLGRYSSDNPDVMRQHIRWAKDAGINGFIVSWKSTDKLNRRLDQLVEIADQENFKLVILYEGLDFQRNPLPIEQMNADLSYFISRYAHNQAFDLFKKPMVILSGTWQYSAEEIQNVVQHKRDDIFVLATEKNVKGYQRLAKLIDGDAYYWSSVNPDNNSTYLEKLKAMGEAVHENAGIWIAPAAPGYDSQLVGGTTVVDRKNGETLRTEIKAALQSTPDAIGLISWNEFSENSHIEPSQNYGDLSLRVLAETRFITPNPK